MVNLGKKYDSDYLKKIVELLELREQKMKKELGECGKKNVKGYRQVYCCEKRT